MTNRELRQALSEQSQLLFSLILSRKITLHDIPFSIRRVSRKLYVAENRASRYNREEHIRYLNLLFSDYDKLLSREWPVLWDLVNNTLVYDKELLKETGIALPKTFLPESAYADWCYAHRFQ